MATVSTAESDLPVEVWSRIGDIARELGDLAQIEVVFEEGHGYFVTGTSLGGDSIESIYSDGEWREVLS
jgi:hypothetical protein